MRTRNTARRLTAWLAPRLGLEALENRAVPATLYVDDDWVLLAPGTDPDGAGPATAIGTDAFATIQDGVNAATAGDTVQVAAGEYPENVVVNKALTLLGAQANVPLTGRTLGGAAESTVDPVAGFQVFQAAADGVVINGFSITTTGVTLQGVNESTGLAGTTVSNSLISGFTASVGVAVTAGSTNTVVQFNDVSNNYAGVYLSTGATGATVSQNDIHNNVDVLAAGADAGSGIVLEWNNTGVTITQNFLRNNAGAGVYVFNLGPSLAGTRLFNNSITGNADGGVVNTNTAVLDAPGNWWGTATAAGVAAAAGPNVDYSPWLGSGADTSAAFGFQGNFSALTASAASPQAGTVGQTQQAIDLAAPGATVTLTDGTYAESNIRVNKPLTIQGQSEAGVLVVPDVADVNEDSSFGGAFRHAFIVESDNVTIRTLSIDGDPTNTGVYGYRTGIITDFFFTPGPYDALTVQDVTVNDVYRRGVQLSDVSTGNSITGVTVDDVGLASASGIGIASFSGAGTIRNNTVTNAFTGIAVNFADPNAGTAPTQVVIDGNTITVRNATAGAGGVGLSLYGVVGLGSVVTGNTIDLTADPDADDGILFADARGGSTIISGNTILASGGDTGIIVSEASAANAPVIRGNTLTATGSAAAGTGEGVAVLLTDDFDLTGSAGGDTFATVSNNIITGFVTGVQLLDRATAPADTTTVNAFIASQTLSGLTNGLLATGGGGTLNTSFLTITNNTGVGLAVSGFDTVSMFDLTVTGNGGTQSVATTPGGTIDVIATPAATPFTITASGTRLVAGPTGGTANQPIALSGEANLNLTGGSGADTFNVTPPATGTTITVTGGQPTTLPGDVLDVDFTGATGTALTATGSASGFSGSYTLDPLHGSGAFVA
jgi:hypothetical protein